ncbi:hypothetical protein [Kineosporia babensis]|uniref:Uncharacterized protein n=1 Tax=Kineosporia babensis TaxID=499548 RepID=A0A9X1NLY7_9ACTN|nr:hypothetical protein [Kineosporia babensis]MCD5316583.1 hypothetical protein [Kineosporia babensis]
MKRRTACWLIEDDLRAFGAQVALALPSAWWMCSRPGLNAVHAHAAVLEALECGGGFQCFLPLPAGAEPPAGSLVGSGVSATPGLRVQALVQLQAAVVHPAGLFGPGHLQAGWLAGSTASEQADQVWGALSEVCGPGLSIGPAARELVLGQGLQLSEGGDERFQLS